MSEWKEYALKHLTDIRVSNVDKKIHNGKSLVKLCNYMDVYSNDYIKNNIPFQIGSADINELSRFSLKFDDVIITKDSESPDDIAIPAVISELIDHLVCGYHLAILRTDQSQIYGIFLMHKLKLPEVKTYFFQVANGSTRYGLTIGDIENVKISIPTFLPEQRKIARILSTVDAVIEKSEAAIAKYKAIKSGMMRDLFTRGIDLKTGKLRPSFEDAPELYKQSELGWVPKEWDVEPLIKLSKDGLKNGYFKKPEYVGWGYKLINVTDLYQPFEIDIYQKDVQRVFATSSDYGKYEVQLGDLFFTRSSLVLEGIAHCNILLALPEKAVWECHVVRLRPDKQKINPKYLGCYCTTYEARLFFMSIAKQVTMTTISQPDIAKLPVRFPSSIDEQNEIAKRFRAIDKRLTENDSV